MRFVDDEEVDVATEEVLEKVSILEAFGSHIQQVALTRFDLPVGFARFRVCQVRVHGDRIDPLGGELVVLVFHQGDQRGHYDGQSREQ